MLRTQIEVWLVCPLVCVDLPCLSSIRPKEQLLFKEAACGLCGLCCTGLVLVLYAARHWCCVMCLPPSSVSPSYPPFTFNSLF